MQASETAVREGVLPVRRKHLRLGFDLGRLSSEVAAFTALAPVLSTFIPLHEWSD